MSDHDTLVPRDESDAPSAQAGGAGPKRAFISGIVVATVALLAHLCASFGLFALAPLWATPLLVGGIAATASGASWRRAAAGTGSGLILGVLVARPWFLGQPIAGLHSPILAGALFVVLGSVVAAAVAYLLGTAHRRESVETGIAVALVVAIVGGMWLTASVVNSGAFSSEGTSLDQTLSVRPELGNTPEDHDYYLRLFYDVHDGLPYYDSVARIWLADTEGIHSLPIGVTSYRLPTIFYLWRVLPRDGAALPWAFLVFATLAVGSSFAIGSQLSRPGVAVLGALMVGVAYLLLATTTWVTFVDGWAVAFSLAGIALFIASERGHSQRLLWASVGAFFVGASMRELMIYPMLLAAASVFFLPKKLRWREVRPWLVGLAAFMVLYAAHVIAIAGRVSSKVGYGYWLRGGLAHLVATLQFFNLYFGGHPWFVPALVFVGLAGAITLRSSQVRLSVFLTAAIAGPLAAFLFFGNGGVEIGNGAATGYWGILVVPIALALVPVAVDCAMLAVDQATERQSAS